MYLPRAIIRHVLITLSFVLLYLLLNRPEIVFFSRIGFVAWYPAIGLAMALMLGISPWYAILVCFSVALAGKVMYEQPVLSFSGTVDAAGIAGCYGAAAYALRGPLQIDPGLGRRRDVVRYLFISAVAAAGATVVGVACLIADHSITWGEYNAAVVVWFLGDAIGLVGIAPFLLVHVLPRIRRWLSPPSQLQPIRAHPKRTQVTFGALVENCAQALMILAVCWAMFAAKDERYGHFYICFIPIIWIAMRHGVQRVVTGLLAMNFGTVVAMHVFPPTEAVFTKVGLFMLVLSAVGLTVGSEVSERHRLATAMKEQATYLDSLIQNNPLGIVVLDRQGRVELANSAFEKLFLYQRDELSSIDMESMRTADDGGTDSAQLMPQIFAGNALHKTVQQRRKDGKLLDLALHGVPLLLNGEVRGAYLIYEDISEQTKALAAQRRHAESSDLLVKELELRTKQMSAMNEMGDLLQCSGTVQEACVVVSHFVQKLFPEAPSGALYLFRSSRDLIEAAVRWGKKDVLAPTFPPEACWSLRRGQPHWSESPGGGMACQHLTKSSSLESLCVAMVAQGHTIGVLHLEFENAIRLRNGSGTLRESHQQLAVSVASQIALSLASLQLRETLREQSIRDPLTRLFNRRFLEESLERELQLASRKKQATSILFLDLDHFKRFNDTFGHDAGDMVLQSLADLFRTFFRATDICCRYGGEEFAIILPESSAQDAAIRADALRSEVKSLRLQYKKQSVGTLSLSAGIAAFPEHGSTSGELLEIADHCLYQSKARGRDVVTVASPQTV
ncbi:MAG TPA: diguanylate cyclase [Candidatus Deferrimicrobiaceae bacterium]|jgi:diguanylate cyclase (GGDEF)-like protein/PAS domain S-box-containing protein|nr:diguanylate cyclase [Candidatus Deferrimicrobiaceae bacterium]